MPKPTASARKSSSTRGGPPLKLSVSRRKNGAANKSSARRNGRTVTALEPASRGARGEERRRDRVSQRAAAEIAPAAANSRGKYVYCVIEAIDALRFGQIGIGAEPSDVYTVHYRNLAAVVSEAPLEVLDSTRENVLAHERVNETVMREHTVIPMSFGTIF